MTKVVMRKNLQKLEKERQRNKIHANISDEQKLSFTGSHGKKEGFVRQRDRQDES